MRYALRNQAKIQANLGADVLEQLLDSLKLHFKSHPTIHTDKARSGKTYPTIDVTNHKDKNVIFKFYVVGETFDVYRLAYCETLKTNINQ